MKDVDYRNEVKDLKLWSIINTAPIEPIEFSAEFESKIQLELSTFAEIIEKMSLRILEDPKRIAELQILEPLQNVLTLKNPKLMTHPVFRVDAFVDPETLNLSILEINASDPSGISWNDDLLRSTISHSIFEQRKMSCHWLVKAHAVNTKKCYEINCETFSLPVKTVPWIAFVIELESFVLHDFYHLSQKYWEMGFKATLLSPEDLSKVLASDEENPDIIYTDSLFDIYGEPGSDYHPDPELIKYIEKKSTLVLNPATSLIAEQKNFLAILSEECEHNFLNKRETDLINNIIPWTRRVIKTSNIEFNGKNFSSFEDLFFEKKDELVLKPSYGYGGEGVYIGKVLSESDWFKIVKDIAALDKPYVVQEYVNVNTIQLPKGNDSKLKEKSEYNIVYSFWMVAGELAGAYARYSKDAIVNVTKDAGMLPIVFSA